MKISCCFSVATLAFASSFSLAEIAMDMVVVGNPGNMPDARYRSGGVGSVDYTYGIGKYEVTAGQYVEFLNAVAGDDTYGLYNSNMLTSNFGCKIERTGSSGYYEYSVAPDWANRPVNHVSFWDAARFANWLHNGQPSGRQDATTTEDGSYTLNGCTGDGGADITRNENATYVIPSEDEWYKAAYHKNDGITDNYWDYPTRSNEKPSNDLLSPDPGNNANFRSGYNDYTIGSPYYRTVVGEFENSFSPYGTFDQAGNIEEWNDTEIWSGRGVNGSPFIPEDFSDHMHAQSRGSADPSLEADIIGFRIGVVPEPTMFALCSFAALLLTLAKYRGR